MVASFGLDWVLVLLVLLSLMFYFNRLVGSLMTVICKILLWKQYKVSVHFQSFKISLLAGRIFFKNFSIVTKDCTICILEGNITWRYWFFNVKQSEFGLANQELDDGGESNSPIRNEGLSSRFRVEMDGLEVFVYNRTYAFMSVLEELQKSSNANVKNITPISSNFERRNHDNVIVNHRRFTSGSLDGSDRSKDSLCENTSSNHSQDEIDSTGSSVFDIIKCLPIDLKIHKCGIVIGNENTTSVVVCSFINGRGSFDIGCAANPSVDFYRHNIKLSSEKFQITLKPNISYKEPISSSFLNSSDFSIHKEYTRKRRQRRFRKYKNLWTSFLKIMQIKKHKKQDTHDKSIEDKNEWKGLPQFLENEDDNLLNDYSDLQDELSQEYAIYRTVVDAEKCEILYYYDIPGKVPHDGQINNEKLGKSADGSPKTGVEIELYESTIYYGPWADRQRISIYKAFFPQSNNFEDSQPTKKLDAGETREYSFFDFCVRFVDDKSIIRVPMREYSKDIANSLNRSKKMADTAKMEKGSEPDSFVNKESKENEETGKKPFAWLELKLFEGSFINSVTDYERTSNGSDVKLNVLLKEPELRSSINHNIFYRAKEHRLDISINYPLIWKQIIKWNISNKTSSCEFFILREHVSLISDMINDFATVEESLLNDPCETVNSYNLFRPYEYNVNWKIENGVKLYLNINNQNIINNPVDFDDNTYLSFQAPSLNIDLSIPMHVIFQKSNSINFDISSENLSLVVDTPAWSTLNTFLKNKELANGTDFKIRGSYTYYSSIELNLVDSIIVNCFLSNTTFHAYGFLIKFIMDIKENYFGENIHFQTLEEYTDKKHENENIEHDSDSAFSSNNGEKSVKPAFESEPEFRSRSRNKTKEPKQFRRIENEIDVLFSFCVDNGCLILPCNLYDSDSFIAARLPNFDIDIRFTNYYMDLQCDISPLKVTHVVNDPDAVNRVVHDTDLNINPDMFINGLSIHGHRIFGLPPLEPTYICVWDISAGAISLNTNGLFIQSFLGSIQNLGYTFRDFENSLIVEIPELNDVTIFTFKCPSVSASLLDRESKVCLNLSLEPINLRLNDLANGRYSSRMDLKIKNIILKMTEQESSKILLYLTTSLYLSNFCRKKEFTEHRRLQQEHLKTNDGPFHRSPFFLREENRDEYYNKNYGKILASLSLPDIAAPITNQTVDFIFEDSPIGDRQLNSSNIFDSSEDVLDTSSVTSTDEDFGEAEADSSLLEFLPNKKLSGKKLNSKQHKKILGENYFIDTTNIADVTPQLDMSDERYEYDNFIFNLSSIDGFLSPSSVLGLVKIADGFIDSSADIILDKLQLFVLTKLLLMEESTFAAKNIRFITPSVNVYYGDFSKDATIDGFENVINSEKNDKGCFSDLSKVFDMNYIYLSVKTPSIVASFKESMTNKETASESLIAMHLPAVSIKVVNLDAPNSEDSAATLRFEDFEIWLDQSLSVVSSFDLEALEVSLDSEQIKWLAKIIKYNSDCLMPAIDQLQALGTRFEYSIIELIYKLSIASEKYNIHHDSSVLTKPTYITRNSEAKHVRSFDSWRILVRLRHILKSLPAEWDEKTFVDSENWKDHDNAFNHVLEVFSKWRSWEFSDIRRSFVFKSAFKNLFKDEEKQPSKSKGLYVNISNLVVRLESKLEQDIIRLIGLEAETFSQYGRDLKVALELRSIESKISTISLCLIDAIIILGTMLPSKSMTDENQELSTKTKDGGDIHVSASLGKFKNTIVIDRIHHEFEVLGVLSSNVSLSESLDQNALNNILHLDSCSSKICLDKEIFAQNSVNGIDVNISNTGSFINNLTVLESNIDSVYCDISRGSYDYLKLLAVINNYEINQLAHIKQSLQRLSSGTTTNDKESTTTKEQGSLLGILDNIKISSNFAVENFYWNIDVLSPVLVSGKIGRSEFSTVLAKRMVYCEYNFDGLECNFIHNTYGKKFLARYQQSYSSMVIKGNLNEDRPLIQLDWNSKINEFSIPSALRSLNDILNAKVQLNGIVDEYVSYGKMIQEKLEVMLKTEPTSEESHKNSDPGLNEFLEKVMFKTCIVNNIIKFSVGVDETKAELKFMDTTFLGGNFDIDSSESLVKTALYGDLILPTTSLSLFDPIVPQYLTQLIEFNLEIKLSSSKGQEDSRRMVEMTSDFFRIFLNPYSLVKIMEIIVRAQIINEAFIENEAEIGQVVTPVVTPGSNTSPELFFKNLSIHILSYNFCFGWLFGGEESQAVGKGVIVGCERVYIITEETLGKLTIVDGYCSSLGNDTSVNFNAKNDSTQRALLPNVQLIFSISKSSKGTKSLNVKVTGEVLDVRLISQYFYTSDNLIKSLAIFQNLKAELVPTINYQKKPVTELGDSNYIDSLGTFFASVNCVINFAGANIRIDRSQTSESSLELHSPAVEISIGYKKVIGALKHLVRCDVTTFASDNTLESSCVPVLMDIWYGINSMMKHDSLMRTKELMTKENCIEDEENAALSSHPIDYVALIHNIDFSGLLNIQPQSLTLSCAPNAKINAVISTGGIKLQLNTVEEGEKLGAGSLLFSEMTAKLQHAYSREVSGSFSIGQIMINAILHQENQLLKIITSGEISKIISYVKVSQLQDLNIFMDTWMPKDLMEQYENPFSKVSSYEAPEISETNESKSKTFAERFQQVSTTNAFPWNVNFVISDVSLKIDLGQSLGVASLLLDKFWLVQRKSSHWEQNLTIGMDSLVLKCEGRLTAEIAIRNSRLNSVIMWATENEVYEIPLVFLSGGVEAFEIIIGFDYHTIFVANVEHFYLSLFNQRDQDEANLDKLFGTASLKQVNIYTTCLASSTFVDIVNAFMRIRANTESSYNEVLLDAGANALKKENSKPTKQKDYSILEKFTNLKTGVGVTIEGFLLQIYPTSLMDTDVLVVNSGRVGAKYSRRLEKEKLSSDLSLQWNNLDVALSKLRTAFQHKQVDFGNFALYIEHSLGAKGGTIFTLPMISIAMETSQLNNDKHVNYTFNSSFGGNVDIRWNLGSINFIRAMHESHEKALSSRLAKNKMLSKSSSLAEEKLEALKIKERVEHAEHDSEYEYVAIEPPVIEPPHLKELGDITPPLEWFGLHRKNFPALTHHFFILPLEQFVINVEKQYNSVLGKA
ncbi:Csf1 protein [Saccharomycopsis crataegensis]|uniref:Csf1 protein n=1 Tax=Saccharomycopsis crataegensis TaxID=43959 RepID=A0AAV5QV66_9ASCO|nr:Csf1 protein [Saccharomycopsis crataegensis]